MALLTFAPNVTLTGCSDHREGVLDDEMLQLAEHIIKTKAGEFDPKEFDDRYESALAELVQAKIEGRKIKPQKRPEPTKVVSLLDALRESAKGGAGKKAAKAAAASKEAPGRKAG